MVQNPSIFWYLKLLVNPINGYSNKPFVQDPAVFNQPAEWNVTGRLAVANFLLGYPGLKLETPFYSPSLEVKGHAFN